MKQLFITTRNIISTCGELRLIKNRNTTLFEDSEIKTDYITIVKQSRSQDPYLEDLGVGYTLKVIYYKDKSIISFIKSYLNFLGCILSMVRKREYQVICLSGLLLGPVRKIISLLSTANIYIDVHGTLNEIIEYPKYKKIISWLLFWLYKFDLKVQLKKSNKVLVVSQALANHLISDFNVPSGIFLIIPCGVNFREFEYDQYFIERYKWRERYGLDDETIVFIYSGGLSKWQKIEESIELFDFVSKSLNAKSKMIVFTSSEYFPSAKNSEVIFDRLPSSEIGNALKMGDFGFLLRDENMTNKVAFPNKFSEYIAAGVEVILNNSIIDLCEYVEKYNLGIIYNNNFPELINYIEVSMAKRKLKINTFMEDKSLFLEKIDFKNTCKRYLEV